MKIVQLTAENIKRLRAIEITPDRDMVVISGRNGQGKSSVLDAIWFALGGKGAAHGTGRPIRDGEDHAAVTLDLGDMIVTRTWSANDKTTLKVTAADGARYSSPQSILDGLVGRLSFDPLGFAQMDERAQLKALLEVVDLPFDPEQLDAERKRYFEDRTQANRRVKELSAQMHALPVYPVGTPDEEVSSADVVQSIRNATEWQHIAHDRRSRAQSLEARVTELRKELAASEGELSAAYALIADLPIPLPDPTVYEQQLADLEKTNQMVRDKKRAVEVKGWLDQALALSADLSGKILAVDQIKRDGIAAASMPVDGLGFDEDGVTYTGVPFKQASSAEQLRVSVAMAMALNPDLRVVRITDGSLLDSTSFRMIAEMAAEHDFQVWVEVVDESGSVGVVIEDGEVVST